MIKHGMGLAASFPTSLYFSNYHFACLHENWECIRPNTCRWLNWTQILNFWYILITVSLPVEPGHYLTNYGLTRHNGGW